MAARKKATRKTATKKTAKKATAKKKTTAKRATSTRAKKKAAGKKKSAKKTANKTAKKKATAKKAPSKAASKKKATAKKAPSKKKATAKKAAAKPAPKKTSRKASAKRAAAAPDAVPERPTTPGRAVIAFRGSEDRNRLGDKWTCYECAAPFYDLGRSPAVCPKCGTDQTKKPKQSGSSQTPSPAASTRRATRPMAPLLEEDDDAVRYDEEFDMGVQDSDDDAERSTGDPSLFTESTDTEEPEETEEES